MNSYEAKQEARRERLEAAADRAERNAAAAYKRADMSEAATGIPFGQPILVGHHSERGHRAAIKRADNAMRKSIDESKRAGDLRAKADGVGSGGISSDDPDAVDKLREELAQVEARQAMMAGGNKIIRAFYKRVKDVESGADFELYLAKMKEVGIGEKAARQILKPDCMGAIGFASYQLSNNSANARRIKQRIVQVERIAAQREANPEPKEEERNGVRIVENFEENRLQLFFPGKPDAEVRSKLKSFGFRWSPSEGAWQRQLNNGARYAAEQIVGA
jgi:hypothetical protein